MPSDEQFAEYVERAEADLRYWKARAEAAEKREAALREALAEIAYLDSPQVRGLPRRQSIHDIANAALEAKL